MKLSFVVIYVQDVATSVKFYESVFGLQCKLLHESGQYAEMETGGTTLGFTGPELSSSLHPNGFRANRADQPPAGIQLAFEPRDVGAAYRQALARGATAVTEPEHKPWGWESAFVRDPDGVLIELARELRSINPNPIGA